MWSFVVIQGTGKVRPVLIVGFLGCSGMKFELQSVVNRELFKDSKQENNMIMMI